MSLVLPHPPPASHSFLRLDYRKTTCCAGDVRLCPRSDSVFVWLCHCVCVCGPESGEQRKAMATGGVVVAGHGGGISFSRLVDSQYGKASFIKSTH